MGGLQCKTICCLNKDKDYSDKETKDISHKDNIFSIISNTSLLNQVNKKYSHHIFSSSRAKLRVKTLICLKPCFGVYNEEDFRKESNENNENYSFSNKDSLLLKNSIKTATPYNDINKGLGQDEAVELSENDFHLLKNKIKIIFPKLNNHDVIIFIQNFYYQEFKKSTILIEGTENLFLYIIKSGKIGVMKGNSLKKELSTGDCFGNIHFFKRNNKNQEIVFKFLEDSSLFLISSKKIEVLKKEFLINKHYILLKCINSINLLKYLDYYDKLSLLEEINTVSFKKGETIQDRTETINSIFIIIEGECLKEVGTTSAKEGVGFVINEQILYENNKKSQYSFVSSNCSTVIITIKSMTKLFGENFRKFFLYRLFSYVSKSNKFLLKTIKESNLRDLIYEDNVDTNNSSLYEENLFLYRQNEKFIDVPLKTKSTESSFSVYSKFIYKSYNQNEIVMSNDENKLIIVVKGSVLDINTNHIYTNNDIIIKDLHNFNSFTGLSKKVFVLEVKIKDLLSFKKFSRDEKESFNHLRLFIYNTKWMSFFTHDVLIQLKDLIKKMSFSKEKLIFKSTDQPNGLLLLMNGEVIQDVSHKVIHKKGEVIGEKELFFGEFYNENYIAKSNCELLFLSNEVLKVFISENMMKHIKNLFINKHFLDIQSIKLLSFLGNGGFGSVSLIKTHNNIAFAMKTITKNSLRSKKYLYNYLLQEKKSILSCNSPFIVLLNSTFQDENFCYLIMEYINGTSLLSFERRNLFKFSFKECLFYFANMIVMLESTRENCIIHRDIKTSNIIVDQTGYLKLIDFGLAKQTKDFTFTTIGTSYYMSPEVILGKGYSFQVDIWSVGVVLYKLYFGKYPFGDDCFNCIDIYNSILNDNFEVFDYKNHKNHEKDYENIKESIDFTKNDKFYNEENTINHEDIVNLLKSTLIKSPKERKYKLKDFQNLIKNYNLNDVQNLKAIPPIFPKILFEKESFYNENDFDAISKDEKENKSYNQANTITYNTKFDFNSNSPNKTKVKKMYNTIQEQKVNSKYIIIERDGQSFKRVIEKMKGIEYSQDKFYKYIASKNKFNFKNELSEVVRKEKDILLDF